MTNCDPIEVTTVYYSCYITSSLVVISMVTTGIIYYVIYRLALSKITPMQTGLAFQDQPRDILSAQLKVNVLEVFICMKNGVFDPSQNRFTDFFPP